MIHQLTKQSSFQLPVVQCQKYLEQMGYAKIPSKTTLYRLLRVLPAQSMKVCT